MTRLGDVQRNETRRENAFNVTDGFALVGHRGHCGGDVVAHAAE